MKKNRAVVLGASGSIGKYLYNQLRSNGFTVVGTCFTSSSDDLIEFDVTKQSLSDIVPDVCETDMIFIMFAKINPNWVFYNSIESHEINVCATKKIIDQANEVGAKIFFPSTEYVFDGKNGGYIETNKTNPSTLYGIQKVEVEDYIIRNVTNWCIFRLGANIMMSKSVYCPISNMYNSLLKGDAKIALDNQFTITKVEDTIDCLITLACDDKYLNNIYHISALPYVDRLTVVNSIIRYSKYREMMQYLTIESLDMIDFPERRPKKHWLSNKKLLKTIKYEFQIPEKIIQDKVKILDEL